MSLTQIHNRMVAGAPANVLDFGADPTGVADSQPAIQAAIDSGAYTIVIPDGTYLLNSGLVIQPSDPVREINGDGLVTLRLNTSVASKAIEIQTGKQFLRIYDIILESTGTKTDPYLTYGIMVDTSSYLKFENIRATNFSGAGLECRGCVYVGLKNYTAGSCFFGLSFQLGSLSTQNTAVSIERAYISGCSRGFTDTGGVDIVANSVVMEYCGDAVDSHAALHLVGSSVVMNFPYWEANYRNVIATDANLQMKNHYGWSDPGSALNNISYSGTAADQRGWDVNLGYQTTMARLKPDTYTNRDLTIGENLTVPVAGGSVNFGGQTMETVTGTATSATWTTVKALTGQSGDGAARKTYRYSIYAGRADLTTGYDSGVVLNGTLYSDSGSTPAWLRVNSNNLQVNITNSSYGLAYGCTLTVIEGIGAP